MTPPAKSKFLSDRQKSQGAAASVQPFGTIKNKKGHHLNTPPLWETSRAQHCQAERYAWAMEKLWLRRLT
jgi:hypothetical protein